MKKAVLTITAGDRSATVIFSYEKYADQGEWEVGGDDSLSKTFSFFADQPTMAYNGYAADTDMNKTYDHIEICAQMVADCYGGEVVADGVLVFPPSEDDPDVVY